MTYTDIVFDGAPGRQGPRFVEVEDSTGKSIKFGDWVQRPDGYWALRIQPAATDAAPTIRNPLMVASEADNQPTYGDVKSWHRHIREALGLDARAPYRFDYYAQVIEQRKASEAGAAPYAYEFGKSNGDGTYSVVIERGDIEQVGPRKYEYVAPKNAAKERAVKPLYEHPAPVEAGAVPVAYRYRNGVGSWTLTFDDSRDDAEPLFAAPPSAPAAEPVAYRYRRSEGEKWHYGEHPKSWWECQALVPAAPAAEPIELLRKIIEDGYLSDTMRHRARRLLDTSSSAAESAEPFAWTTPDDREPISDALKLARPDLYGKHYTVPLFKPTTAATADAKCINCNGDGGVVSAYGTETCDRCNGTGRATADTQGIAGSLPYALAGLAVGDAITKATADAQGDERAEEVIYRWQALDFSGYCYGGNPPDNPGVRNLKAFYAQPNYAIEALRNIAYTVNRTATQQKFADHLQREARAALAAAKPGDSDA